MERTLLKSRMTAWIYLVAWIQLCLYTSGVWCIDMCGDRSQTTRQTQLTHEEYPQWTEERGCQCNISADNDVHLIMKINFQYAHKRKEVCRPGDASHLLIRNEKKSAQMLVCSSETTNASLTIYLEESDTTSITLFNPNSRKLRFNVDITVGEDITIQCGTIFVVAPLPITETDEGGGYTGRSTLAAIIIGLVLVIGLFISRCLCNLLDYREKCNCLFPRTENIYASQDFNDGTGDNPAYEATPKSSVASSTTAIPNEKGFHPNGRQVGFQNAYPNGNVTKGGFINKALNTKPLASVQKGKYRPEGDNAVPKSFYTNSSGMGPFNTFEPQESLSIERYDTPPESLEPSIVPHNVYPVSASPLETDPNMNIIRQPMHRGSVPCSMDRPLEVPGNGKNQPPENTNPYLPTSTNNPTRGVAREQPVNRNHPVKSPYTAHPDYPHYGNIAPPFNVSADSIIYMDHEEIDDFFLRQKRKPEVGFVPDPNKKYTPMITTVYKPPGPEQKKKPLQGTGFQPINTPTNPAFLRSPGPVPENDDMQFQNDRDLQSPISSHYASPLDTPTAQRRHDPVSSITSSPSHAGYMTPPQDLVEMRRSSASPHLDNFSVGSKAFETDV